MFTGEELIYHITEFKKQGLSDNEIQLRLEFLDMEKEIRQINHRGEINA